jgi:hypothetical protein
MKYSNVNLIMVLFLSFLVLGGCGTNNNNKKENDLDEMNLFGKVKSMRLIKHKVTEELGENTQQSDVSSSSDYYYVFDKNGYEKEVVSHSDGVLYSRDVSEYNQNEDLVISHHYNYQYSSLESRWIYKYDENRFLTEIKEYKPDGKLSTSTILRYDENNNVFEKIWYSRLLNRTSRYEYKYDKEGNEIECTSYRQNGDLFGKDVYTYDKKRNKITEIHYSDGDYIEYNHTYKYDKFNNITEKQYKTMNGLTDNIMTYKYEFDSHNNWVKKLYYENGDIFSITKRTIEYYR